jgi:membrane protease YdiL (CAAX protease family)
MEHPRDRQQEYPLTPAEPPVGPPAPPPAPPFHAVPPPPPPSQWGGPPARSGWPPPHWPVGWTLSAWLVILLLALGAFAVNALELRRPQPTAGPREDRLGVVIMELQARYLVGVGEVYPAQRAALYRQSEPDLNRGSIPQRQRFVILAGELASREEAAARLNDLDALIEQLRQRFGDDPPLLTPGQQYVQFALHALYAGEEGAAAIEMPTEVRDALAALGVRVRMGPGVDRNLLIQELGWFGELALAPPWTDDMAARRRAINPAVRTMYLALSVFGIAALAAFAGLIGLVTLAVLAIIGRVRSAIHLGRWHHGIYAETFAVWMLMFILLQVAAMLMGSMVPEHRMLIALVAFFASLFALVWPVMRGIPWRDVRIDIGLTAGRRPALEPLIGIAGYLTALPVLAVGAILTFILIQIQQRFSPPPGDLDPTSGPAHPIIEQLAGDDWYLRIMVLLLGAVAAPVVEEIMFRGVLYRHLRDASRGMGIFGSVFISTFVNSFVFAIIHPQGLVGVPVLMSLAIMFTLYREWRGTLVPAIVMHGLSNFLVLTLLMVALNL